MSTAPRRAFLPAIADDGVPASIGLVLIVSRDLEGEGFVMFERRTAVDADTRDAGNREFDDQYITRFAGRVVAGRTVDGANRAVGEDCGVKAGGRLGALSYQRQIVFFANSESLRFEARCKLADVALRDVPPGQLESNSKLSRCHVRFVPEADTVTHFGVQAAGTRYGFGESC